jgi:hypothetical protein
LDVTYRLAESTNVFAQISKGSLAPHAGPAIAAPTANLVNVSTATQLMISGVTDW